MGSTTCCQSNQKLSFQTEIVAPQPEPAPSAASLYLKQFLAGHPAINAVLAEEPMFSQYRKYFNRDELLSKARMTRQFQGTFIGQQGKKEGYGIWIDKSEEYYEGEWKEGLRDGKGILIGKEGEYYCGEWKIGLPHGYGLSRFVRPTAQYKGYWEYGLKHGQGEERCSDGTKYMGTYLSGQKSGQGKFVYPDGSSYEGEFVSNRMEGMGIYRGKEQMYEGTWKNGRMHGAGHCQWYNKDKQVAGKYLGEYREGVKEGYGEYTDFKGTVYKGMWLAGQLNQFAPIDIMVNEKLH